MLGFSSIAEVALAEINAGFGSDTGGAAPVSTHRAQYAGIRLAKKQKKKRDALRVVAEAPPQVVEPKPAPAPLTVIGRGLLLDPTRDQITARGDVVITGRGLLEEVTPTDVVTALGMVAIFGKASVTETSTDVLIPAVAIVSSDEDEALQALYEVMPHLRGMKIKLTEDA